MFDATQIKFLITTKMKGNLKSTIGDMNILIVDDVHELLPDGLEEVGHHVLYLPNANREEIKANISGKHILIIRSKTQVDQELMDQADSLLCIARAGAGLDNIDEAYAVQKGILCINAGEANADAVGEHTIGMLLSLLNHLSRANKEVRQKIWRREANRGLELAGKTVGIIGFGNTGKAVAKKLQGFELKILVYDKYLVNYGTPYAIESSLDQIFEEADIVTFHIPLTRETNWMVDMKFLNRFKKKIFLLNLSRGKILKTEDLVQELKSGKVLGCALDVLENEDLKSLNEEEEIVFNRLLDFENVILSPHIGGWTVESYRKISQVLLGKLLTFRGTN